MNSRCKLVEISKYLEDNFRAKEITLNEFISENSNISPEEIKENSKVYKISDELIIQSLLNENEKSEIKVTIEHLEKDVEYIDKSSYEYGISTGKLIVIILESEDGESLSGFIMDGNGQLLFDFLLKLIGDDFEKSTNSLEEMIEEFRHFKPYGTF